MRKNKKYGGARPAADASLAATAEPGGRVEAFTFGDPVSVLDSREIFDCFECWRVGDWYEPPVDLAGLAKSFTASVHHSSAILFKVNILTSTFKPSAILSREDFKRLALDHLTFGNCYGEARRSATNRLLKIKPSLAKYTRRGVEDAIEPAANVFARHEIAPLQAQFEAINEWAGEQVISFDPYNLSTGE